nr:helix-turn-helix transcriptional regulator [uncultured Brevundimonas sp.]
MPQRQTSQCMARVSGKSDDEGALPKLGAAILTRRREVALSQEALADASGIDRSHMGKIERGERNVTLLNVLKIAQALGCSASDLLRRGGL